MNVTQFRRGNVEWLAQATLHDVTLVVEEGGQAVQYSWQQERSKTGQTQEQVTCGADILNIESQLIQV